MWSFLTGLTAPKYFFYFTEKLMPWLIISFVLSLGYGLAGGLWLAPADYMQGDGFRIIYVHVPAAFLSLMVYFIMAAGAFVGTVWRVKLAFTVIRQSAPLGFCFTLLALITGSIWGKPMWGTWWIWDARLTSELILMFLYLGIMLFQSAVAEKKSGEKACAILVLVGFLDIPIIHYSVNWWNTLHQGQTLKLFSPSAIDGTMLYPLLSMMSAFTLYYAIVLIYRIRCEIVILGQNQHWLQIK